MPEFVLDTRTNSLTPLPPFASLPEFVQGYIEAMFFTDETGPGPGPGRLHDAACYADLDPAYLEQIRNECALFEARHAMLLLGAYDAPRRDPYGPTEAGRDFWYGRQGHGTGFWDRGLGLVGDCLAEHARRFSYSNVTLTKLVA